MEFAACAFALNWQNLPFVEFAGEFCGLAAVTELHDAAILHLFRLRANYQRPMDLPDTTGLCWREGIYRCLGSFRSQVETSPLVSPLAPPSSSSSPLVPSSSSSSPLVLPSSSSLVPPSSSLSPLVPSSSALPERPLVPLGLLVDYEGMVWSPALEPAPHQRPPVPAPRQRPPVPAPRQRPKRPRESEPPEHPRESEPPERPQELVPFSSPLPLLVPSSSVCLRRARIAHLCLRWSHPAHLRPRWHCPVQRFQSAPETQHYPSAEKESALPERPRESLHRRCQEHECRRRSADGRSQPQHWPLQPGAARGTSWLSGDRGPAAGARSPCEHGPRRGPPSAAAVHSSAGPPALDCGCDARACFICDTHLSATDAELKVLILGFFDQMIHRRYTESMLLEVQCEVSRVSDDLGCHDICWCWSTVFSEVHSQRSHLPGDYRALHASFCWQALWRCWFHFHLPTLPMVPKAGSMAMVLLCLIGQQTGLTFFFWS